METPWYPMITQPNLEESLPVAAVRCKKCTGGFTDFKELVGKNVAAEFSTTEPTFEV